MRLGQANGRVYRAWPEMPRARRMTSSRARMLRGTKFALGLVTISCPSHGAAAFVRMVRGPDRMALPGWPGLAKASNRARGPVCSPAGPCNDAH